jgi:hypothetical protein
MAAGGKEVLMLGRTFTALAGLLAALGLAACGSEDTAAPEAVSPRAAVMQAADQTSAAGSYRASFEMTMSGLAPEPMTMKGDGIFDSSARQGQMTMDMSEFAASSGQDLGEAEVIFDDFVVYMRFPFLTQLQPNLKPWLKIDIREFGKQQGLDFGQLSQLNQDPSQTLQYLRAASGDVEEIGTEEVRGVETTHYGMTVDLRKVVEQAPEAFRGQLRASIDQLIELSGVRSVPTEVWIDDDGLARRMRLTYENMRFAPGQQGDMTMEMDLYDFGVDVDVKPPPKDKVTDHQELMTQGG